MVKFRGNQLDHGNLLAACSLLLEVTKLGKSACTRAQVQPTYLILYVLEVASFATACAMVRTPSLALALSK